MRKTLGLAATLALVAGCHHPTEPDDPEIPTFNPGIQGRLLETVRFDPPQGENLEYMAWNVLDRQGMTPWTTLSEAESKRSELASKYPGMPFTVVWRSNPAPTRGTIPVRTPNE